MKTEKIASLFFRNCFQCYTLQRWAKNQHSFNHQNKKVQSKPHTAAEGPQIESKYWKAMFWPNDCPLVSEDKI